MAQRAIHVRSNDERFVIKTRLGGGGMGEVFLAEDRLLKRRVAMKAIRPEHSQDTEFRRRLCQEAEQASQLDDEHIARIYDIAEHEGQLFVIMEYVGGQTLRARLREPLSTEEFFSIAEQCLGGLAAAHRRGILHCDLKPENLMITPAGQVKILDFGFARRVETNETRESLELSQAVMGGTPGYMAPEVLMGNPPDERSDIFAMGVVLYEALLGRHPFRQEPNLGTAARIVREEPHAIPSSVPAGLDQVLTQMLAKDPTQRYQSCVDVLNDIRAIHAGRKPLLGKTGSIRRYLSLQRVAILLAVIVLALVAPKLWRMLAGPQPVEASSRQLVILPFKPVTDDTDSRAFASGLTETMAAKLGQIADRYPLEIVAIS